MPTSFLDLPRKVRLQIYTHLFASSAIDVCTKRRSLYDEDHDIGDLFVLRTDCVWPNILLACKAVYQESRVVFYGTTTFCFKRCWWQERIADARRRCRDRVLPKLICTTQPELAPLRQIGRKNAACIKTISVNYQYMRDSFFFFFWPFPTIQTVHVLYGSVFFEEAAGRRVCEVQDSELIEYANHKLACVWLGRYPWKFRLDEGIKQRLWITCTWYEFKETLQNYENWESGMVVVGWQSSSSVCTRSANMLSRIVYSTLQHKQSRGTFFTSTLTPQTMRKTVYIPILQ